MFRNKHREPIAFVLKKWSLVQVHLCLQHPTQISSVIFVACFEDPFANISGFTDEMNYHCLIHLSNTTLNTINITVLQPQMCDCHFMGSNFLSIAVATLETDSCKIHEILQITQKNNDRDNRKGKKKKDT